MLMARPFVYKVGKPGKPGYRTIPKRPPNLEHLMLMARPFVYKVGKPWKPGYRTIPKDPQTWSI